MSSNKKITFYFAKDSAHCGSCGEPIDGHHGKMVSCDRIWRKPPMQKNDAITFAKKYLEVRKVEQMHPINIPVHYKTPNQLNEKLEHVWNVAVEYILLDIIPYLYGEALD
jgi:hypothetical protein